LATQYLYLLFVAHLCEPGIYWLSNFWLHDEPSKSFHHFNMEAL
jgi:hypothetical protein